MGRPATGIPAKIDAHLHDIAERAAGRHSDPLLDAMGWTRTEYVAAIHNRLRNKYRRRRDEGRLTVDNTGQIRIKGSE